ncbi:MAG: DesA family fatty acid desaturase [Candidatus Comchoanobacterales bacterium]
MLEIFYTGLWPVSFLGKLIYTLVVTHITIVAVTVYLHRAQAHRSLEVKPLLGWFFRIWVWMTTTMVTTQWVAVHRKHHAKVETKDDPHSPRVYGIKAIVFNGVYYYRQGKNTPGVIDQYSLGCPNDFFERALLNSRVFQYSGILIVLAFNILMFGALSGLVIWGVQMIWIPALAAGVINGIGHYWGYRNYSTEDDSTNIMPWGVIIGGEELHNNHHAFPTSPKLSMKAFEFDIGYVYIKLFERLKWVKIKQKPMSLDQPAEKISDIIRAKVLVLSKFSRQVVKPLLRTKKAMFKASNIGSYSGFKRVLTRPFTLINTMDYELIKQVSKQDTELNVMCQFKERLEGIYAKRLKAPQLLKEIDEWCQQAYQSGIESLKHYGEQLKHFIDGVHSDVKA